MSPSSEPVHATRIGRICALPVEEPQSLLRPLVSGNRAGLHAGTLM